MGKSSLNQEGRFDIVKRNTAEILGEDDLKRLVLEKKKPVIYWGTAPTGKPHVGYLLPLLKIGCVMYTSIFQFE